MMGNALPSKEGQLIPSGTVLGIWKFPSLPELEPLLMTPILHCHPSPCQIFAGSSRPPRTLFPLVAHFTAPAIWNNT